MGSNEIDGDRRSIVSMAAHYGVFSSAHINRFSPQIRGRLIIEIHPIIRDVARSSIDKMLRSSDVDS